MIRRLVSAAFILAFAGTLGACGDTWRGAKKDTGQNIEATGEALERTGEKIKR